MGRISYLVLVGIEGLVDPLYLIDDSRFCLFEATVQVLHLWSFSP